MINTTSPTRNLNLSYHGPFTFYKRFHKTEVEKFAAMAQVHVQPNELLEKKRKKSSVKESLNVMVASWNKKRDEKSESLQVEDVPGNDGFSSQLHFGLLDINKEDPFLPFIQDRPPRLDWPTDDFRNMYKDLLFSINSLASSVTNNDHLSTLSYGHITDCCIVQLEAKKFVCCQLDNVELVDWVSGNKNSRLWHCLDLKKSPLLLSAIKQSLTKRVRMNILLNFSMESIQMSYNFLVLSWLI